MLPASVAMTVQLNEPPAVGVPLRTPADDSVTPAGSEPATTAKVYGAIPPLAVTVCEYALPTPPTGRLAGAMTMAGGATLSV